MADAQTVTNAAELADKWGQQLADIVSKHGPDAADLALAVGKAGALTDLLQSGAGMVAGVAILLIAIYLLKAGMRGFNDPRSSGEEAIPLIVGGMMFGLGGICTVVNAIALLNIYAWVGLSHPEVWLAAKALKL